MTDPTGTATILPGLKRCLVVAVLGRNQAPRDPDKTETLPEPEHVPELVNEAGRVLNGEGFPVIVRPGTWPGPTRITEAGNTYTAHENLKVDLFSYFAVRGVLNPRSCECICFIGYSRGGGHVYKLSKWMSSMFPQVVQPYAATVEAIKVWPARWDITSSPLKERVEGVRYHQHWRAQYGQPTPGWVRGTAIENIDPGRNVFKPGTEHASIQRMPPPPDVRLWWLGYRTVKNAGSEVLSEILPQVRLRCWR